MFYHLDFGAVNTGWLHRASVGLRSRSWLGDDVKGAPSDTPGLRLRTSGAGRCLGSCDVVEVKDKVLVATVLAWLVPVNRLGNSRGVGRRVKGGGRQNYPPEIRR